MNEIFECPICKSHNHIKIGNDKIGYGLVKLDLKTKTIIENPNPEYLAVNVYICSDCNHVEFKVISLDN